MGQVVPKSLIRGTEGRCCAPSLGFIYVKGGVMPEQYTYQVGKIHFIVTPVYKDKRTGETMENILLKLILQEQKAD